MAKRWIAGLLSILAAFPASAIAAGPGSLYSRVLHTYQTSGSIPPCRFSSQQLAAAQSDVDTYGQQYYADFIAAIQTALAARASGTCSQSHRSAVSASSGQGSSSGGSAPAGPRVPGSVTASTSSGVPAALVVLGILAAVLAGAAALSAAARRRGTGGEWSHGWAEARYRAGGIWGARAGRRR